MFQPKTTTYKVYTTVATSPNVLWSKELAKKAIKRQKWIVAEIYQNRTADKGRFFKGFFVAQIKKCSTNKTLDITWAICTGNRRSKRYTENFHEFLWCSTENSFRTATSPNLYLTRIRGFSLHNNEIKITRRGHYSSNDFQDSNKRKTNEYKHWVISQECFSLTPLS
jgi:hypothetical protein